MNSPLPELRLDWASGAAAKFACERWHYTGKLPNAGVRIGVWEGGEFAGVILFGVGAARATDGRKYGLARAKDVAELTRVALRPGHRHQVSRCIAIAVRMLRRQSPGLRLLISFADAGQGHHGGIYQAGGWLYAGHDRSQHDSLVHRPRPPPTPADDPLERLAAERGVASGPRRPGRAVRVSAAEASLPPAP